MRHTIFLVLAIGRLGCLSARRGAGGTREEVLSVPLEVRFSLVHSSVSRFSAWTLFRLLWDVLNRCLSWLLL